MDIDHERTILIGPNNSGKTSVLEAVATALGSRPASEDDLHLDGAGVRASYFVVDLQFHPQGANRIDAASVGLLGSAVRPPVPNDDRDFFVLRASGDPNPDGGSLRIKRSFLQDWSCDPQTASRILEVGRTSWTREVQDLFEFSLMDARRDIVADLRSRTSIWGRLVADLGLPPELKAEIETALATLSDKITGGSQILKRLGEALERVKQAMASGIDSVSISPLPPRVEELGRAIDVLVTAPGSAPVPMRLQGMGGRSLSALAVFRAFVELRMGIDSSVIPLSLCAIEEPEAHLHPQAHHAVVQDLADLKGQKLISTHSPYVAGACDIRDIRLLRRVGPSVVVRQLTRSLNPTETSAVARLVQRRHGDILFARVVILFEGQTEESLVKSFADFHWSALPPSGHGISLVGVGGAEGYRPFVAVLDDLGIPWLILSDADQAGIDAMAGLSSMLGRQLDANAPEIVMLPGGGSIEHALATMGALDEIEGAIEGFYGAGTLATYRRTLHGQPRRKGAPNRDYQSAGWRERLLEDFLTGEKTTYGEPVAAALSAAKKIPSFITDIFNRVDVILSLP